MQTIQQVLWLCVAKSLHQNANRSTPAVDPLPSQKARRLLIAKQSAASLCARRGDSGGVSWFLRSSRFLGITLGLDGFLDEALAFFAQVTELYLYLLQVSSL